MKDHHSRIWYPTKTTKKYLNGAYSFILCVLSVFVGFFCKHRRRRVTAGIIVKSLHLPDSAVISLIRDHKLNTSGLIRLGIFLFL